MRNNCKKCGVTSGHPMYQAGTDLLLFTCVCGFAWTRDPVDKGSQKDRLYAEFADPALNANVGHGHVYRRPDGALSRCGGPAMCPECAKDLARQQRELRAAGFERKPSELD